MINDTITMKGQLTLTLKDAKGATKREVVVPNLVVTAGKALIASRLASAAASVITHMGVGTGSTAAAVGNTALETQSARVALTGTTVDTVTLTYSANFAAGVATGALTEAGLFNASTAGTMLCRTVFPAINKEADDVLTINWNVTVN